jgi:glycosyltransferase involved in cell wall biosynthesis
VTPSYNQGEFLEETIRSVLLQGYPNLEYIVIDGGSTDGSVNILEKYDPWIDYWVSEPDQGQSAAINKGFSKASGKIGGWLNSDDIYLPDALRKVAVAWSELKEPSILVGWGRVVAEDGSLIRTHENKSLNESSIIKWGLEECIPQPAVFYPVENFDRVGGVDESLYYTMDMDLWVKMGRKIGFHQIEGYLSEAKKHEKAKTYNGGEEFLLERLQVQARYGAENCVTNTAKELHNRPKIESIKDIYKFGKETIKYIIGK